MMDATSNEKPVLIDLGKVRIRQYDSLNVVIEKLEEVVKPKTDETVTRWRFKGYSRTIMTALQFIISNELLIDKKAVSDLESYLKQVEEITMRVQRELEVPSEYFR
ncbi:hypothetical protein BK128_08425 [Viridibacillus sp. FSL H7-0596]|uniref:hypothetical protein n=1 Tax=Viridibacillus sp. FSL H7-0596 TaxID=1928923 RepID=UPI00096D6062|nr:hypothetical protein [Viridibacillus sp. FSL H7-0596]OMC87442.1 hypothetical protein BK128_08425 [Viridibacillus sp. FSL H7-0596]